MKGIIASFRRGRKVQTMNQMIIVPQEATVETSEKLVGKAVVFTTPAGKELKGQITAIHGRKVLFEHFLKLVCQVKLLGKKFPSNRYFFFYTIFFSVFQLRFLCTSCDN